jgi:hypothetical protein
MVEERRPQPPLLSTGSGFEAAAIQSTKIKRGVSSPERVETGEGLITSIQYLMPQDIPFDNFTARQPVLGWLQAAA